MKRISLVLFFLISVLTGFAQCPLADLANDMEDTGGALQKFLAKDKKNTKAWSLFRKSGAAADVRQNEKLLAEFVADFGSDAAAIARFERTPELMDGWRSLENVSNAIRKENSNLEKVVNALKQDGYDISYFENLIKSKVDPQKFINDYVSKIANNGKFVDDALEADYAKYLTRKAREGKPPRDRADWNEASDYMKYDSPTARGNNFNKRGELIYDVNELNLVLKDGAFVRIDSYVPPRNGVGGQIISRKATDLVDIKESVFRGHLQEMVDKYSSGTKIRSNAYPILDGKTIQGKQYLQIPKSNEVFYDIERYKKIAKNEFGIEIIFLAE